MQIEIMRHHGRAQNAEREVEHLPVAQDVRSRREAFDHRAPIGIGERDLHRKAGRDYPEHRDHKGFDPTEAERLQRQDQEHIGRRDDNADLEGNVEQEVEPDRGADHLGKVGRGDCDFRRQPQRHGYPARRGVAAGLGKVPAGADAKPRAQRLQHDRHQVGQHRNR